MESTATTFAVSEPVSVEPAAGHLSNERSCSTDPVLRYNISTIEVFQTIEGLVWKEKLYAKATMNATTTHATVKYQRWRPQTVLLIEAALYK